MKILLLVLGLLTITAFAAHEIQVNSADDILRHLQGNNYNIYLIHFFESAKNDQATVSTNKDLQTAMNKILSSNPDFFHATIDLSQHELTRLGSIIGLTSTPSILLIVHGKGVWVSGQSADLVTERLRDFLPKFVQASAHHSNPY
ncbi:unnamed protein product [Moneuplotes crassus]|uniref:Uncharacterized protein n=2 Tax=Euplotes crassus TaxID=5936 RepID=A0AAD2D7M5_EUPCR|nr:unnamed protein product [Moneuplotes crassus]